MPPITQGTRGGLITAVVIFSILFVASTITAIVFGVKWSKEAQSVQVMKRKYADVIADAALATPEVAALVQAKNEPGVFNLNTNMKGLDVAMAQRDGLARTITGNASSAV